MKMHIKGLNKKKSHKQYLLVIVIIIITFVFLNNQEKKLTLDNTIKFLIDQTTHKEQNVILKKGKSYLSSIYTTPEKHLLLLKKLIKEEKKIKPVLNNTNDNLIYIYNTHQTEEYLPTDFIEYNLRPTVMVADYIIQDILNKNNYKTLVEERKIKDILNQNSWSYAYSYKASRIFLEDAILNNPTLKYFIDVHRDSLSKDKTTTKIGDKSYAKLLFIVGLENKNYNENLKFTEEINACLNSNFPTLSKGIYKKQGPGVNGIYNQDFSPYTILVEIGGYENSINEVMNSSTAFSICFMEVIKKH